MLHNSGIVSFLQTLQLVCSLILLFARTCNCANLKILIINVRYYLQSKIFTGSKERIWKSVNKCSITNVNDIYNISPEQEIEYIRKDISYVAM